MTNKTTGQLIAALRKEQGMTQKELAEMLHITDKAVSKWERDLAFPDTGTLPRLAEILGISVEELLGAKAAPMPGHRGPRYLFDLVLRVLPAAMGVAVTTLAVLGQLTQSSGFALLGIGMAALGIRQLEDK